MLRIVSLFAGVGGFELAFQRAGARVVASVEIDPAARTVLSRRFPDTALFPDVTKVGGDELRSAGFVPERGVITAGFPCQDISIAGRRVGLAGERSGLFWEIVRLLDELRPAWVVLENVPNLLSINDGRDMGAVVGSLAELGYGYAYRVLDAQFFGVPQRRRRVFVVGHLGSPFGAAAQVLFEPESGAGDSAEGGETWPGTAGFAACGVDAASGLDNTHTHRSRRCRAAGNAATGSTPNQRRAGISSSVVAALTANGVGTCGADDNQAQAGHIICVTGGVTHTLTSEGADASEDGTGRGTPIVVQADEHAYQCHGSNVGPMGTLRQGNGALTGGVPFIVQPLAVRGRDGGAELEAGKPGAPYNALRAGDGGSSRQSLIAVTSLAVAGDFSSSEDVAQTVRAANGQPGVMLHENQRGELTTNDTAGALNTGGGKPGQGYPAVATDTIVRRLTPLECERLQGFPDDWTFGSDAQRYRQMGNSLAVPVVEWIARRLIAVDEELQP